MLSRRRRRGVDDRLECLTIRALSRDHDAFFDLDRVVRVLDFASASAAASPRSRNIRAVTSACEMSRNSGIDDRNPSSKSNVSFARLPPSRTYSLGSGSVAPNVVAASSGVYVMGAFHKVWSGSSGASRAREVSTNTPTFISAFNWSEEGFRHRVVWTQRAGLGRRLI